MPITSPCLPLPHSPSAANLVEVETTNHYHNIRNEYVTIESRKKRNVDNLSALNYADQPKCAFAVTIELYGTGEDGYLLHHETIHLIVVNNRRVKRTRAMPHPPLV